MSELLEAWLLAQLRNRGFSTINRTNIPGGSGSVGQPVEQFEGAYLWRMDCILGSQKIVQLETIRYTVAGGSFANVIC